MNLRKNKLFTIYKAAQSTQPTLISFDFDDTLMNQFGASIDKNVSKLMSHISNGDKVIVVTSRQNNEKNIAEINHFLNENGISNLISGIYLVGGIKQPTLSALGVFKHYDDNEIELSALNGTGIIAVPS